ncbi:hypothetical protein BDZ97DRAFT_1863035 [Flammula alnicola]|nr:hypothetical protein BDZ97DRAFT_1863035 [Flammula alnicola]
MWRTGFWKGLETPPILRHRPPHIPRRIFINFRTSRFTGSFDDFSFLYSLDPSLRQLIFFVWFLFFSFPFLLPCIFLMSFTLFFHSLFPMGFQCGQKFRYLSSLQVLVLEIIIFSPSQTVLQFASLRHRQLFISHKPLILLRYYHQHDLF